MTPQWKAHFKQRSFEQRKPILIVQHAPHEHPAILLRVLEAQGIETHWIHPYRGGKYPKLSEIAGMISLGGPMSANDESKHPWIFEECQLLKKCIGNELPVVGICLGAQMMAKAMGACVEPNPTAEVGWFPIIVSQEGLVDAVLGVAGSQPIVYHWHADTFHLPAGAELLAYSQACERQAFRIGENAYGLQFHPEADHQLVHEWLSIEGVEKDIHLAQKMHGTSSVQDAETQKNHALKGEKASLKITAAIGAIFRKRSVGKPQRDIYKKLSQHLTQRNSVVIQVQGSKRKLIQIQGRIITFLTTSLGEYVILREESEVLWPICVEDILELKLPL